MKTASRSSGKPRSPALPEATIRHIETHLARREARREQLHDEARALRRQAQGVMIALHEGRSERRGVHSLRTRMRALGRSVRADAAIDAPLARDALQEGVEAILLEAALRNATFPGPAELGVEVEPYLLGLGDVVGELRRLALSDLANDRWASAERWVVTMEHLYQTLMRFDTTRAIVPLKPKQDTARALLERTRGEVVMARVHARHSLPRATAEENA